MPDLPKFSGFEIHEVLPTGDSRKIHEITLFRTSESLISNEVVVLLECNSHEVAKKNFPVGASSAEIAAWLNTISDGHQDNCPIEDEEVTNATDEGGG